MTSIAKREAPICIICMERMGCQCTLPFVKAEHQKAVAALEKYLADREPNEVGEKLIKLTIRVEAMKGCIKTREELPGIIMW